WRRSCRSAGRCCPGAISTRWRVCRLPSRRCCCCSACSKRRCRRWHARRPRRQRSSPAPSPRFATRNRPRALNCYDQFLETQMAVNKDEILDAISKMTLLDVMELVSDMEKKFGVTAAAPVAVAAAPGAGAAAAAPVEEKTEFAVTLQEYPADKKVTVIKVIREITGLGLKEAKDLVEGVPSLVKEGVNKADSDAMKKKLEDAGARVEIR